MKLHFWKLLLLIRIRIIETWPLRVPDKVVVVQYSFWKFQPKWYIPILHSFENPAAKSVSPTSALQWFHGVGGSFPSMSNPPKVCNLWPSAMLGLAFQIYPLRIWLTTRDSGRTLGCLVLLSSGHKLCWALCTERREIQGMLLLLSSIFLEMPYCGYMIYMAVRSTLTYVSMSQQHLCKNIKLCRTIDCQGIIIM